MAAGLFSLQIVEVEAVKSLLCHQRKSIYHCKDKKEKICHSRPEGYNFETRMAQVFSVGEITSPAFSIVGKKMHHENPNNTVYPMRPLVSTK